eukprot:11122178-Karenia_brevis.AAC.1
MPKTPPSPPSVGTAITAAVRNLWSPRHRRRGVGVVVAGQKPPLVLFKYSLHRIAQKWQGACESEDHNPRYKAGCSASHVDEKDWEGEKGSLVPLLILFDVVTVAKRYMVRNVLAMGVQVLKGRLQAAVSQDMETFQKVFAFAIKEDIPALPRGRM